MDTEKKRVDCHKLDVEEKTIEQIALERCDCLINQYLDWKKENHSKSVIAQGSALIFTAAIPVVLLLTEWKYAAIASAALSALAAIATGLLVINGWRENFTRYGYIYHMLLVEKYLYLAQATDDYSKENKTQNFVKRIEGFVTLDVTEWRSVMENIKDRDLPRPDQNPNG